MKTLNLSTNNNLFDKTNQTDFFKVYHQKKFAKDFYPKFDLHCHAYVEIYFMFDGESKFTVNGRHFTLKSGDIILIPPNVMHKADYTSAITCSYFVVFCDTKYFHEEIFSQIDSLDYYVGNIPKSLGNAEEIFRKLLWEHKSPDEHSSVMIKSLIVTLSVLLMRSKKSNNTLEVKSTFVKSTISYIKENYSNPITLESAAKNATVSTTYLSRTFKKETGYRFKESLVLYRLAQSEAMLIEYPDRTILEVAYECGFNDSNYFTLSFKKLYGITPSDFRNGKIATRQRIFTL